MKKNIKLTYQDFQYKELKDCYHGLFYHSILINPKCKLPFVRKKIMKYSSQNKLLILSFIIIQL